MSISVVVMPCRDNPKRSFAQNGHPGLHNTSIPSTNVDELIDDSLLIVVMMMPTGHCAVKRPTQKETRRTREVLPSTTPTQRRDPSLRYPMCVALPHPITAREPFPRCRRAAAEGHRRGPRSRRVGHPRPRVDRGRESAPRSPRRSSSGPERCRPETTRRRVLRRCPASLVVPPCVHGGRVIALSGAHASARTSTCGSAVPATTVCDPNGRWVPAAARSRAPPAPRGRREVAVLPDGPEQRRSPAYGGQRAPTQMFVERVCASEHPDQRNPAARVEGGHDLQPAGPRAHRARSVVVGERQRLHHPHPVLVGLRA